MAIFRTANFSDDMAMSIYLPYEQVAKAILQMSSKSEPIWLFPRLPNNPEILVAT